MEDRRRTRSQGLPEGEQLQWDSLQDSVRIEREQAEARRQTRGVSAVININRRAIENSEIPQLKEGQPGVIAKARSRQIIKARKVIQTPHPNRVRSHKNIQVSIVHSM